jgi:hypothetical protein
MKASIITMPMRASRRGEELASAARAVPGSLRPRAASRLVADSKKMKKDMANFFSFATFAHPQMDATGPAEEGMTRVSKPAS